GDTRYRTARAAVRSAVRPAHLRSRMGILAQGMTPQLADYFGVSKRSGALVVYVYPDTPAAKAGIKTGDVILSIAGETVDGPADVSRIISQRAKDTVEVKVMRDKQEQTITLQMDKGDASWFNGPDSFDVDTLVVRPVVVAAPVVRVHI